MMSGVVSLSEAVVLMDLDVKIFGARKALSPEDLDKKPEDIPEEFYLGHQALLPKEALKFGRKLEGRGRQVLDKYGTTFPVGETRAIPVAVLDKVEAELTELRAEFFRWVNHEVIPNYPKWRDAAIEKFGAKLVPFFPDVKAVRKRFAFEWITINIALPTGDDANAKKVRERIDKWVDRVAVDLREAAAETLKNLAENCASTSPAAIASISDARFKKMRDVLSRVRACNFISDTEMNKILDEAEALLDKTQTADLRSEPSARQEMRAALNTLVGSLKGKAVVSVTTEFKRKLRI